MGRTIEGAIHEIESELHHQRCDCGTAQLSTGLRDAMKTAVDTMYKYQRIQEIVKNTQQLCSYGSAFIDIREVIKDGNDNNRIHEEKV